MPLDTSSYYPEPLLPSEDDSRLSGREELPPQPHMTEETDSGSPRQHDSKDSDPLSGIDVLATALSWIFVPMLMPVYGIMLVFGLSILSFSPWVSKVSFTLVVAAFNLLLPFVLILILKKMGVVKDMGLNERKERLIPYIIVAACLGATAYFMYFKHAPLWLVSFYVGGMATALVNLIINLWWKISAHAAGIAGVVALLFRIYAEGYPQGDVVGWAVAAIILSGLLGSARIWLRRHTVWQILAGYAVGFAGVYFL